MLLVIAIGAQLLFTASDFLGRKYMMVHGFNLATFSKPWFIAYFIIRIVAMFGQLYIFSRLDLGKTLLLFAILALILANFLGVLFLQETIGIKQYIALSLTILAFLILIL